MRAIRSTTPGQTGRPRARSTNPARSTAGRAGATAALLSACVLALAAAPAAGQACSDAAGRTFSSSSPFPQDAFGQDLAIDGDDLVVAKAAIFGQGRIHVFRRSGAAWTLLQELVGRGTVPSDQFGHTVDAQDGTMLVGAGGEGDVGAVFVFERIAGAWTETSKLSPAPGHEAFGGSIALDGDVAVVSSFQVVGVGHVGSVHVFERSLGAWSLATTLRASDPAHDWYFGRDVAASGARVAVGAPGAVYVFERGPGGWQETARIERGDPTDFFGQSVALESSTLVAGAPGTLSPGRAFVFVAGPQGWSEVAAFDPAGGHLATCFGSSVAIHRGRIAVGGPEPHTPAPGMVHVFRPTADGYVRTAHVAPPLSTVFGHGAAVALSDELLACGAVVNGQPNTPGTVRVYELARFPESYCSAKTASNGCAPFVRVQGVPTGQDPFLVEAVGVPGGESGVLLYSFARSSLDFHGGTLCVKLPFTRTAPVQSTPAGFAPCAWVLQRDLGPVIQSDPALFAGQTVHTQWICRDPADPAGFGDALSDAVTFTVCP